MSAHGYIARDAQYRCLACAHEWIGRRGPTVCPSCGHLYVKWLNYETTAMVGKIGPLARVAAVIFLCAALTACGSGTQVVTVREPPRVTRMDVPPALLTACVRAKDGAPDPATATNLDAARFIVQLVGRNDDCADRLDRVRGLLAP